MVFTSLSIPLRKVSSWRIQFPESFARRFLTSSCAFSTGRSDRKCIACSHSSRHARVFSSKRASWFTAASRSVTAEDNPNFASASLSALRAFAAPMMRLVSRNSRLTRRNTVIATKSFVAVFRRPSEILSYPSFWRLEKKESYFFKSGSDVKRSSQRVCSFDAAWIHPHQSLSLHWIPRASIFNLRLPLH